MNHKKKAEWYFQNNFNCSQAVFATFATELGMEEELALKVATQFGGGARKGEMCGAVSGALMVLGLKYGHSHANDGDEKKKAYQVSEDFMNRFIEEKGTVVCRDLLGYDLTKADEAKKIQELGLFQTVCAEMIRCATGILDEIIKEIEKDG